MSRDLTRALVATLGLTLGASAAHATGPTPGALTADRLKLPSGPNSVRGLAGEPEVHPFAAEVSYQVPIELPPGLGELTPSLALIYSGDLGNGPLGIGWQLPAVRIERSTRLGVPRFDATDELELSGVASGRVFAIGGSEYRVEGQGQTVRVTALATGGFEVRDGNGVTYRLGTSSASRQESGARTRGWLVEDVDNLAGEHIHYDYDHDRGQVYLSRITWGPGGVYQVTLGYEARTDAVTSYREGFEVTTARRLATITVQAFGEVRRAYQLGYDQSFPLSRLVRVASTGRGGAGAWPTTTFRYAQPNAAAVTPVAGIGSWRLNDNGTSLVDLDGDGAADLLQLDEGGHSYRINENGTFGAPIALTGETDSISRLQLMDVDGDARPELLQDTGDGWVVWHWSKTQWISTGVEWPGTSGLALKQPTTTRFADLNGDGLIDALQWDNDSLKIHDATRTGFSPAREVGRIGGAVLPSDRGRFEDFNGDGLDDYIEVQADRLDVYIGLGDGTFLPVRAIAYPFTGGVSNLDDVLLADLDRDGLLDLVKVDLGDVRWFRGLPAGGFDGNAVQVSSPEPLDTDVVVSVSDIDGNGSADLVWSSTSGMWSLDLSGPTTAGMLAGVANGLGLDVSFSYQSSHALSAAARAANAPWASEVPMAIPVPVEMVRALGPAEPARHVSYGVRDGFWDAVERRFGGFLTTTVTTWGATPAQTSTLTTRYHQGTGTNRVLRGKPLTEQLFDGTGKRIAATTNSWVALAVAGLPAAEPRLRRAVLSDSRGRFEESTPARETHVTYSYDTLGRAIRSVDQGRTDLDYDDVVTVQSWGDDATNWVRDRPCEEKILDSLGNVVSQTQTLYGDESVQQPLGTIGKGWVREVRGLDVAHNRWVSQKLTSYDGNGRPIVVYDRGVTRSYVYDASGLFVAEEHVALSPTTELVWRATWDRAIGQVIDVLGPDGHHARRRYDALGRVAGFAVDGRAEHRSIDYDWTAPAPKTTLWEFDGPAAQLAARPTTWTPQSRWRQSVEVANGLGEVRYQARRLGTSQWIVSDWKERDPNSRVVFEGNPTMVGALDVTARPSGMTGIARTFDPLGRPIEEVTPTGSTRVYTYSAFERTLTDDDLAPVHSVFDGHGHVLVTDRALADGTSERVEARYDAAGRVTRVWLGDGSKVTRQFGYDTLGRLLSTSDPDLGTRSFTYDDADRLTSETNAVGQTITYAYDAAGRLTTRAGGAGATYVYHYDAARAGTTATNLMGRLAWIEEPTGSVELSYDDFGQESWKRHTVDGHVAEVTSAFAPSGLLLSRAHDDGLTLSYGYDAAARPTSVNDLWSVTSQDAAGRVLDERFKNGVTARYVRDAMGLPSRVTVRNGAGVALYDVAVTRNAWSGVTAVTDLDGVGLDHAASFGYDGFARLTAATIGSAQPFSFSYSYDALHNMLARTVAGPRPLGILAGTYQYGEGGAGPRQLTSIAGAGATHAFRYDAAGRQTGKDGVTLTFDAMDRLVSVAGLPSAGVESHKYGADGLRVETVAPGGATSYWFDADVVERNGAREHDVVVGGRIVARVSYTRSATAAVAPASPVTTLGALVLPVLVGLFIVGVLFLPTTRRSRRARATAMTLAWSLMAAACGTHEADVRVEQYGLGWTASAPTFLHTGIAAGPTLFTDGSGNVVEERRFEPFGAPIDARRKVGTSYVVGDADFVARDLNELNKRTDATTGWSDHGARWLAPETARWLTPDPPVKAPDPKFMEQPWALNPYQYVEQNPIAYWDPDGREPVKTEFKWSGIKLFDKSMNVKEQKTEYAGWTNTETWFKTSFSGGISQEGKASLTISTAIFSEGVQAPHEYYDARASVSYLSSSMSGSLDLANGNVGGSVGVSVVDVSGGWTVNDYKTDVSLRLGLKVGAQIGNGSFALDAGPISVKLGSDPTVPVTIEESARERGEEWEMPSEPEEEVGMKFHDESLPADAH